MIESDTVLPRFTLRRDAFTLMELLLTISLLAILTAASFGIIYWQMRTHSHVIQSATHVNKLLNTQLLMRKVLRSRPASTLNVTGNLITYEETPGSGIELFSYADSTLKFMSEPILENAAVSFENLTASGSSAPSGALAGNNVNLIKVDLRTTGRETRRLSFLIRPRGQ